MRLLCFELASFATFTVIAAFLLTKEEGRQEPTRKIFTVPERVEQFRSSFDSRLRPALEKAGIEGLPRSVTLAYFKDSQTLELYAEAAGRMLFVKKYRVTAASGEPGPKLREGDLQVPEGIYPIEALNPNSRFHLSLRMGYPNAFDRARAKEDGRGRLGGDIMIHGNEVSTGCIALGDDAIEEIFLLAALTDWARWKVLSAPVDFRKSPIPTEVQGKPSWLPALYSQIKAELALLTAPSTR
jgi:hypothetical protein